MLWEKNPGVEYYYLVLKMMVLDIADWFVCCIREFQAEEVDKKKKANGKKSNGKKNLRKISWRKRKNRPLPISQSNYNSKQLSGWAKIEICVVTLFETCAESLSWQEEDWKNRAKIWTTFFHNRLWGWCCVGYYYCLCKLLLLYSLLLLLLCWLLLLLLHCCGKKTNRTVFESTPRNGHT